MDKNGDFSRRVINALFRVATMDWSRIFAVLRGTIYLQPTVKVPSSCYQWFGNSVPLSGGHGRSRKLRVPLCNNCDSPTCHLAGQIRGGVMSKRAVLLSVYERAIFLPD